MQRRFVLAGLLLTACNAPAARRDNERLAGGSEVAAVDFDAAAARLDARALAWSRKSDWPEVTGGRCSVSCHTTEPYLAARALANAGGGAAMAEVRGYIEDRVRQWDETPPFFAADKVGSRGTEAVLNARSLAAGDHGSGSLSPATRTALAALWALQKPAGNWDWLSNKELIPWAVSGTEYWGAILAGLAVVDAPGYLVEAETDISLRVQLDKLRTYLGNAFGSEPLLARAGGILAGVQLGRVLDDETLNATLAELVSKQCNDGGWALATLGPWPEIAAAGQSAEADGYATGFITYVLGTAPRNASTDIAVAKGLHWLRQHQRSDGAWPGVSLRRPGVELNDGLMTDAATAYAVMALRRIEE